MTENISFATHGYLQHFQITSCHLLLITKMLSEQTRTPNNATFSVMTLTERLSRRFLWRRKGRRVDDAFFASPTLPSSSLKEVSRYDTGHGTSSLTTIAAATTTPTHPSVPSTRARFQRATSTPCIPPSSSSPSKPPSARPLRAAAIFSYDDDDNEALETACCWESTGDS